MLKHLWKRRQEFYFYYVALLIAFIPLYPKFPFIEIRGSQVALRVEDFLIAGALLFLLVNQNKKIFNLFKNKIVQAMILFWIAGLISGISSVYIIQTVNPLIVLLHWARRVEYMLMFVVGYYAVRDKKDLAFYIKILIFVFIYATVYAVGQKYYSWPVITTQNSEYAKGIALRWLPGGHLVSTFAGHYDLASYLILLTPIFYGFLLSKEAREELVKKGGLLLKVVLIGVCVCSYWLIVNAASRISIVSYVGAISMLMVILRKYKYIPVFIFLSFIFLWTSSNLVDRYTRIFKIVISDINAQETAPIRHEPSVTPAPVSVNLFEDRSTSIRLNVEWPRAVRAFAQNPLLGTGYSSIGLATDNDYLRMLGEIGIVGVMAFVLIVIRIFVDAVYGFCKGKLSAIERIYTAGIISALFGIALNMVFIDILEASKFAINLWLFLGILAAVLSNYEANKETR
jgi:hypothetical protein